MENYTSLVKEIADKIKVEIALIDQLLDVYSKLLRSAQTMPPDLVELTAMGSVVHSFYNGLENIFTLIAKNLDEESPQGPQWHSELLYQMTQPKAQRDAVLSKEMKDHLKGYLSFRHFHRHSYSIFLDWEQLERLITPIYEVWAQVKEELRRFITGLEANPRGTP